MSTKASTQCFHFPSHDELQTYPPTHLFIHYFNTFQSKAQTHPLYVYSIHLKHKRKLDNEERNLPLQERRKRIGAPRKTEDNTGPPKRERKEQPQLA